MTPPFSRWGPINDLQIASKGDPGNMWLSFRNSPIALLILLNMSLKYFWKYSLIPQKTFLNASK